MPWRWRYLPPTSTVPINPEKGLSNILIRLCFLQMGASARNKGLASANHRLRCVTTSVYFFSRNCNKQR